MNPVDKLRQRYLAWRNSHTPKVESKPHKRRSPTPSRPQSTAKASTYDTERALAERIHEVFDFSVSQTQLGREIGLSRFQVRDAIERMVKAGNPGAVAYASHRADPKRMARLSVRAHLLRRPNAKLLQRIREELLENGFTYRKNFATIAAELGTTASKVYIVRKALVREGHPDALAHMQRKKSDPSGHAREVQRRIKIVNN